MSALRSALHQVTQPSELPESRRGLRVLEVRPRRGARRGARAHPAETACAQEYLSEAETCDEVYQAVADRVHGSLDQCAAPALPVALALPRCSP